MKNACVVTGYKSKFQNLFNGSDSKSATLYFTVSQKTKSGYENHSCVAFGDLASEISEIPAGKAITVTGTLSSRMIEKDGKKQKITKVIARKVEDYSEFKNSAEISGSKGKFQNVYLDNPGKETVYFQIIQTTKKGFDVHDCIAFGETARKIAEIEPGTHLDITGKISSRLIEKDGKKENTMKVVCNSFVVEEKKPSASVSSSDSASAPAPVSDPVSAESDEDDYYSSADTDFVNVDDDEDFELPFN